MLTELHVQPTAEAAAAEPAGVTGQAHGYIEQVRIPDTITGQRALSTELRNCNDRAHVQAEGLLGQLKGQAGGKFDGFLGMADNLLHKVRPNLQHLQSVPAHANPHTHMLDI